MPPGPPMPRTVLPQNRGTMDRLMDYLVGDGPENRYALICQKCFSHNGMALKEEFEYLGEFRQEQIDCLHPNLLQERTRSIGHQYDSVDGCRNKTEGSDCKKGQGD